MIPHEVICRQAEAWLEAQGLTVLTFCSRTPRGWVDMICRETSGPAFRPHSLVLVEVSEIPSDVPAERVQVIVQVSRHLMSQWRDAHVAHMLDLPYRVEHVVGSRFSFTRTVIFAGPESGLGAEAV